MKKNYLTKRFQKFKEIEYCISALKNLIDMPDVLFEIPYKNQDLFMYIFAFGLIFSATATLVVDHLDMYGLRDGLNLGDCLNFNKEGKF